MHDPAFERRPPDDAVATGDKGSLAMDAHNSGSAAPNELDTAR